MKPINLPEWLGQHSYPGRGIVLGASKCGQHAYVMYFIMGRSENSRNRVFEQMPDNTVQTTAADPKKLADPSLIIYNALRTVGSTTVVTNGDHTDTICACLGQGGTFEDALRTRTYEPDAPHFTSRISGLLTRDANGFQYKMSIIRAGGGAGNPVQRHFFEYPSPQPGIGHFIHTYSGESGTRLHCFEGEPIPVRLPASSLQEMGNTLWQGLNEGNKISLVCRSLNLSGEKTTLVFNKYAILSAL